MLFVRTQNGVRQDKSCLVHRGSLTDCWLHDEVLGEEPS